METTRLYKIAKLSFMLFFLDFFLFMISTLYFGGNGLNGKIENSHYYLNEQGLFNEVSEAVFRFTELHGLSVLFLFVVALITHIRLPDSIRRARMPSMRRSYFILGIVFILGLGFIGLQRVFDIRYHFN